MAANKTHKMEHFFLNEQLINAKINEHVTNKDKNKNKNNNDNNLSNARW